MRETAAQHPDLDAAVLTSCTAVADVDASKNEAMVGVSYCKKTKY